MDTVEFETDTVTIEWLLARQAMKWRRYPPNVIPLWVADMDFPVARCVRQAMEGLVAAGDFGYAMRDGEQPVAALALAFSRHMDEKHGWKLDWQDCVVVGDLVQAMFAATLAFSDPGGTIILHTPSYPPFRQAILGNGRRLAANPLIDTGEGYEVDFDRLVATAGDAQMIFLCNPHNPTGRVFSRQELERIAAIACEWDLVVISDEIHSDFVYDGNRHIPFATISKDVARRTMTLTSATKSYGIAGLRCGIAHFGSPELKQRFEARIPTRLLGSVGVTGIDATIAAWAGGQVWLGEATRYLKANRDFVFETIAHEFPRARVCRPEATYLAWIDFGPLELPATPYEFFLDKAQVALGEGVTFDPACSGFARLNFATTRAILSQALERMVNSVRQRGAK